MFYSRLIAVIFVTLLSLPFATPLALGQPVATGKGANIHARSAGSSSEVILNAGQPVPNRYIIVLKDTVANPAAVANEMARAHGLSNTHVYTKALKGFVATVPAGRLNALSRDPRIAFIEQDQTVRAYVTTFPNFDPNAQNMPTGIARNFNNGTGSTNTLTPVENTGTPLINGLNDRLVDVDVAVIDSGIDGSHPDLNVVPQQVDCVSGTCIPGDATDGAGHGTHVAGTIGAIDNGRGVAGVAPGARLWPVKVLNSSGEGTTSGVVAGIDWVTANGGVNGPIRVANMSLGGPAPRGKRDALCTAIANSVAQGVVHVVASGNDTQDASGFSPARCPDAITVSAIADYDGRPGYAGQADWFGFCDLGADDHNAYFSNYSKTVPLIAAPGVCILSTYIGKDYAWGSGTSMAAPHVAGAAALLASHTSCPGAGNNAPPCTPAQIRSMLNQYGNDNWTDDSPDGIKEKLLGIDNAAFNPKTVDVSGDTTPPTATVAGPADGVQLTGTENITVTASDTVSPPDKLMVTVDIYSGTPGTGVLAAYGVAGFVSAAGGTGTYVAQWDTSGFPDGEYTIVANAKDEATNFGTSVGTTVTVQNSSGGPPGAGTFGLQSGPAGPSVSCTKKANFIQFDVVMVAHPDETLLSSVSTSVYITNTTTGNLWTAGGTTNSEGVLAVKLIKPLSGAYQLWVNGATHPTLAWDGLGTFFDPPTMVGCTW